MYNNTNQLPVHYAPDESRPIKRHHTARYYAHRVRESLTTRISKIICSIFLSLVLIFGIIIFILWLSLRPHRPRFHIHEFTISGLTDPTGFENTQIRFNITIRNSNQGIGVHYDSMNGSIYYKDQVIRSTALLDPFYQKPKATNIVYKELSGATINNQRWMDLLNDRGQGTVKFRLDITSAIRFKVSTWDSKRHRMHASCEIAVGPDGNILPIFKNKRCPVYFTS